VNQLKWELEIDEIENRNNQLSFGEEIFRKC
jgi:hypothetical protein